MALRWIEGFEGASTSLETHARLYASVTGTVVNAEEGASVSTDSAISSSDLVFTTPVLVGAAEDTWIIGMAIRGDAAALINNPDIPYVAVENTDGEQVRFEFLQVTPASAKPGGLYFTVRAMRGATELATSEQLFEFGDNRNSLWIYLELQVTIDNSTGAISGQYQYCRQPSLNGGAATALTWDAAVTSIDTQNQTSTGGDRVVISLDTGNSLSRVAIDDIYICDGSGSKNNDFLGRLVMKGQKPAGDGNTVAWDLAGGAGSVQDAWDELLTGTEDDERLVSDTTTAVALCTVEPLAGLTAGTIIGVRQDIVARMETTGDLDIAHMFRKTTGTPAETDAGTDLNVSSTTYVGSALVLEDDPNTATDWVVTDLNSYQHGVRNDG